MPETLSLFDTCARKQVPFSPDNPSRVLMYTCGPTVYDYAHIGNFRTFVVEDLLRRTLKLLGYQVHQVMNITDVDDKTIKGALKENIPLSEYTARYTSAFFEDLKCLRIEPVESYPKATDYIPDMIKMIEKLIAKSAAYIGQDGSVYFKINASPTYGCLSHLLLSELQEGASERKPHCEYTKEQAADFVLWKAHDQERDKHIFWESPWGIGRPGWHIECSAMASAILGATIDLHAGGVDLIFPHHENEIAQSETSSGQLFCRHWFHVEHLLVDGKKMSKSLNNFLTLRTLLQQGYSGEAVRYLLLSAHYRHQLNFTHTALDGAKQAVQRINDFWNRFERAEPAEKDLPEPPASTSFELSLFEESLFEAFKNALQDDLNISEALAYLFEFIRAMNHAIDAKTLTKTRLQRAQELFLRMNSVLDLLPRQNENTPEQVFPEQIQKLFYERNEARKNKQFQEADRLRQELSIAGYIIEDAPKGSILRRKLG